MRRSGEGLGLSACCFASALILSLCLSTPRTRADRTNSSPAESARKSEPSLTEQIDGFAFLHSPSAPWIDDFRTRSKLTGDWDGRRDVLADNGLTFFADVTQYYQGVAAGGLEQRSRYGGRGDYLANIDTQKMGLWEGGHFDLRGETRLGQDCNEIDGAVALSNFAMALPRRGQDDTALTGVQYTQDLSENLSVFAGKLNLLDGTQASYARGTRLNYFWNTAMQLNLSRSYLFPSILGGGFTVRDEVEPIFNFYLLDTQYAPTTTGLSTLFANGMVAYGEYRLRTNWFDLPGHSAAGFLYSTATRTSLDGNPSLLLEAVLAGDPLPTKNSAWTATFRFDQVVNADTKDLRHNWTLNGDFGLTDGDPNPIGWFANTSLVGGSLIHGREDDTIGIGYYHLAPSNLPVLKIHGIGSENGVEFFYNAAVTPWFHVTPDIQILDPAQQHTETALLVGIRARLSF